MLGVGIGIVLVVFGLIFGGAALNAPADPYGMFLAQGMDWRGSLEHGMFPDSVDDILHRVQEANTNISAPELQKIGKAWKGSIVEEIQGTYNPYKDTINPN